jgi:hypothetical protein
MENQNASYNLRDVYEAGKYFDHAQQGKSELVALHKDFKPGRDYFEDNKANNSFPKIWYTNRPGAFIKFVQEYYKDHMCCVGVNPRPKAFKTYNGYNKSATDADIERVTHFYFDIDFEGKNPTDMQLADLRLALMTMDSFYRDRRFELPTLNYSGNGYHVIHKLPPVSVSEYPDIKQRQQYFKDEFQDSFSGELARLEAIIDNTLDLSRKIKLPGTKKPGHSRLSSLEYVNHKPDEALRDYLLSLDIQPKDDSPLEIRVYQMPETFAVLLEQDRFIQNFWNGTGKTSGDTSRSGYDYSLVRRCLKKGITDINDLYAILTLRPGGSVKAAGKGEKYVKNTIANAIKG